MLEYKEMINLFAIIVCVIIYWVLGAIWFSPKVFGKKWSEALGKNLEDLGPDLKQGLGSLITAIIATSILAFLLELIGTYDAFTGFLVGLLIGVGFIFTVDLYDVLFEQKSVIAFIFDIGYHIVALMIIGIILGIWKV
ncbi:MAG: DUF1761 domain-containing protein [Promethearchaeota archaeon]|nr:MAG: DUF1761 domain-containing protein [Candidatus Lokiarchaeota archaeon]